MAKSNLRHLVKEKTHKERAQPAKRKKYGLLEKHKDYVLRARDYKAKVNRLKKLKEKARYITQIITNQVILELD
jgi:U3 small nucleolar RNA-associated protein 11